MNDTEKSGGRTDELLDQITVLTEQLNAVTDKAFAKLKHVEERLGVIRPGISGSVDLDKVIGARLCYGHFNAGWQLHVMRPDGTFAHLTGVSREERLAAAQVVDALLGQLLRRVRLTCREG